MTSARGSEIAASAAPVHAEDDAELMTGEAVGLDLRPTGFVLRAAGAIIDFVVYFGTCPEFRS